MSFAVKVTTAFDNRDINAIAALCHEDMVFVDDYDMHARDDWLAIIAEQIEDGSMVDFSRDRFIVADRRDIFAMEYIRDLEGAPHRITNVCLKRDGKFWRFQVNRVPL